MNSELFALDMARSRNKLRPEGPPEYFDEGAGFASPPCFMHEIDPEYLFAMPSEPADRIKTKKVHDGPAPNDGRRVLVERLWPRGVSKSAAALDAWEKQLAPSPELRKWYAHEPARWPEFKRRYREELMAQEEELDRLLEFAEQGPLTLVYSTQDRERNSATVLRDVLIERLKRES